MVGWRREASGAGCSVSLRTRTVEYLAKVTPGTDLNLPVVGVAAILITLFVKMKTPEGSLKEKLARMDWMYVVYSITWTRADILGIVATS